VTKKLDSNEDWRRRDEGRTKSKGAMAAERASAGLGTSDDGDASLMFRETSSPVDVWARPQRKPAPPRKPAPSG
jgi:hypothetical protein